MRSRDVTGARVFDASARGADFVGLPRFEREADALDPDRNVATEPHARMSDARKVPFGNDPRKEMHRTVSSTHAGWIEHAPRFARISGRRHDRAQPLHHERDRRP
jgi:hypothetical protein